MEKYGVEQVPQGKGKTAAERPPHKCRGCGADLRPGAGTNVLICDKCGTLPYEK